MRDYYSEEIVPEHDYYSEEVLNKIPHPENFLQRAIRQSSRRPLFSTRDIPAIGHQFAEGIVSNAPENIAQNPMTVAMSGLPGVQAKGGAQGIVGLKQLIFGGEGIPSENTVIEDNSYLTPQTLGGKIIGLGANIAGGGVIPGMVAAKGLKTLGEFPYKETLAIRKSIPPWVRANTQRYGQELENLIQKSGGKIPTEEAASIFKNVAENPDLMDKINPKLRNKIQTNYEDFATRPDEFVDANELITKQQELRKLNPKSQKFDVNEHVIGELSKNTGRTLEPYVKGLKDLNSKYSDFYQLRDFANKTFRPWEGKYNTSRGESVLGSYLKQPEGTKLGLTDLEKAIDRKFVGKTRTRDIAKLGSYGAETLGGYTAIRGIYDFITGGKRGK